MTDPAQPAAAPAADAGQANIVFSVAPIADKQIIHDNDNFTVQWKAFNAGSADSPAFHDLLVIRRVPEGCPGSTIDADHPVVFNSDNADDPSDFLEGPLPAGQEGSLMQTMVGPFPAASYQLAVTLAVDVSNFTTTPTCIDIVQSDPGNGDQ